MTKELAEFIKTACDDQGIGCELYENYSGRGMYGAKTWGVTVPSIAEVMEALLEYFRENIEIAGNDMGEDVYYGAEIPKIESLAWDNMGVDMIVY